MKYICEFYIPVPNSEGRYYALSSCDKASYIHCILNRLGQDVEIISPTFAKKFSKQRIDRLNNHVVVISGYSLGWTNSFTKIFSRISAMLWLLYYLLFKCNRHETIMIYHKVQNIPVLIIAKWLKGFHYILEVEEIYSSLSTKLWQKWRYALEKIIITCSNKYVFASTSLERICNTNKKPFAIATGNYTIPPILKNRYNDGKIHIVYAGLIERGKVAFKCAEIGKYLNEKYYIHIIGYGEDKDIALLEELIETINKQSTCYIQYDGLKRGNEYIAYLQSCHIGICPLSSDKVFQMACFPSKITSYLSNGLLVLTTDNDVLKESSYSDFIYFVKDDNPRSFADAIINMYFDKTLDPRGKITEEDKRFYSEFKYLLHS